MLPLGRIIGLAVAGALITFTASAPLTHADETSQSAGSGPASNARFHGLPASKTSYRSPRLPGSSVA
jgi:hypothetical protein